MDLERDNRRQPQQDTLELAPTSVNGEMQVSQEHGFSSRRLTAMIAGGTLLLGANFPRAVEHVPDEATLPPVPSLTTTEPSKLPPAEAGNFTAIPNEPYPVRDELLRRFEQLLKRDAAVAPRDLVGAYIDALGSAYINGSSQADLVAAVIAQGDFALHEYPEVLSELQKRFPNDPHFAHWGADAAALRALPGGVSVTWISSVLDPYGADILLWKRYENENDHWFPAAGETLAPMLSIGLKGFGTENTHLASDATRVDRGDRLTVDVTLRFWQSGERTDGPEAARLTMREQFTADALGYAQSREIPLELPTSLDGATDLIVRVDYRVAHVRDGEELAAAQFPIESWARLHSVSRAQALAGDGETVSDRSSSEHVGYVVIPLGPGGVEVPVPTVAHSISTQAAYRMLIWRRDDYRGAISAEERRERAQHQLVGQELHELPLIAAPGESPSEAQSVTLPRTGKVHVVFGATWCLPCHHVAPSLREYIAALKDVGSDTRVIRLSTDTDPKQFSAALDGNYPDGVLTVEGWQRFPFRGIPAYLTLENGVIVEADTLTPAVVAQWKREVTVPSAEALSAAYPGSRPPTP